MGPTSYGDSPYQAISSYAGNPYMIDLNELKDVGLLSKAEYQKMEWFGHPAYVDYERMYVHRFDVLRLACARLNENFAYNAFVKKEKAWLHDYALYMTIKILQGGKPFYEWPTSLRKRNTKALQRIEKQYADEITFWKKVQFLFFVQWEDVKAYANEKGIQIIGDIPIYVPMDSVDVWAHQDLFQLDAKSQPKSIAGCPPDGFNADGQVWGNALYRWDKMKKEQYAWWIARLKKQAEYFDVIRIDHFRGFASYFSIPAGETTAHKGHWEKGPGLEFFKVVEKKLGKISFIAEDLGFLTDDVLALVQKTGYPGMKVLQFAFDVNDPNSMYLPHRYPQNCVVYTGTHDNETTMGWFENWPKEQTDKAKEYFHITKEEGLSWGMIRGAYASPADLAIIPVQDFLELDNRARMNEPSTLGNNWKWRLTKDQMNKKLAKKIAHLVALYGRA